MNKCKRNYLLLSLCFLLSSLSVFSEEKRGDWIVSPIIQFYGLHMDIGYRGAEFIEGRDTIIWFGAGGYYLNQSFFRYPDGSLYYIPDGGIDADNDPHFWIFRGDWNVGLTQGFVWNDRINKNLIEGFIHYRGKFDKHFRNSEYDQLLFQSRTVSDKEGILQNSILLGAALNDVSTSPITKVKKGVYSEVSFEWGPSFFLNNLYGEADFFKLNGSIRGFLPIFELEPKNGLNLLSLYGGAFLLFDYTGGSRIPLNEGQSFGGLAPRAGLGGAVRGVFDAAYAAPLKGVFNIEARLNLPALFIKDIVPVLRVVFDSGYYNELDGVHQGLLFTTGGQFGINFFDFVVPSIGFFYFINGENVDRSRFMIFDLAFGFHF